jgi:hypothetical protein
VEEKAVEVGLDGARRHFQFGSNFRVVTTLQQEIGYLLLPRAQANSLLLHRNYPEVQNTLKYRLDTATAPHTLPRARRGDQSISCAKPRSIQDAMLIHLFKYSVDHPTPARETKQFEIANLPDNRRIPEFLEDR